MARSLLVISIILAMLAPVGSSAWTKYPNDAQAWVGQEIVPTFKLPLRKEPPGGFFEPKGDAIGEAKPNEKYRVLEQRDVPTIWGKDRWLKVQPTTPDTASEKTLDGWIYFGPAFTKDPNVEMYSTLEPKPG